MNPVFIIDQCPSASSSLDDSCEHVRLHKRLPLVDQVPAVRQSRVTSAKMGSAATDCDHYLKNDIRSREPKSWPLKRLPIHLIDQSLGTDFNDDDDYAQDFDELTDYSEEVAMILNLDFLSEPDDELKQNDDDSHYSITEDSLDVARRRATAKKESRMKPLSDFRRSFARCAALNGPSDINKTRNTTSPPCA